MQAKYVAKLLSSTSARTGKGLISYAHIDKAYAQNPNDEPKFSLSFIFDKSDTKAKKVLDQAIEAAEQKGVEKFGKSFKNVHLPINDGDEKDDDAYQGKWYINAKNTRRPGVYDADREEMDPEDIYSGCYARIVVDFFPYCRNGNSGVAASLKSIQFLEDGEPLAGGRATAADFADDDDEAGSMLD